jgi:hypothetical protein
VNPTMLGGGYWAPDANQPVPDTDDATQQMSLPIDWPTEETGDALSASLSNLGVATPAASGTPAVPGYVGLELQAAQPGFSLVEWDTPGGFSDLLDCSPV